MNIEDIGMIKCNYANYKHVERPLSDIQFICIHYTANVNDTPTNNCIYFAREALGNASAHYFVRDNEIMQSVPLTHAAFSVGDNTDIKKASMHGVITNANSVSIELCGSMNSTEASDATKSTAAMLTANLLIYLGLKPNRVYRHYDVSGKICPAWAVQTPKQWFEFLSLVYKYHDKLKEGKNMYTEDEYNKFVDMMDRYKKAQAEQDANWGSSERDLCEKYGIMKDGRPYSWLTRKDAYYIVARILRLFGKT